jgi:hypothetical protein
MGAYDDLTKPEPFKKLTYKGEVTTTDGKPPAEGMEAKGAPQPVGPSGQHGAYWVLSQEERAKGFLRPVRSSYRHVGVRPEFPTRELTPEEQTRFQGVGYVAFEEYPKEAQRNSVGRYWTVDQLNSGCGSVTSMGRALAETYARDPKFYGATFCAQCGKHPPVGEFVWDGTEERVGD